MSTPNLAITHIASSQNQKEVTVNSAFDALDKALTGRLPKALTDADYSLTPAEALQNMAVVLTGALTAARNLVVPNNTKLYVVTNATTGGFVATVKTAAGTGIAIAAGATKLLYCDGANVIQVG
jgi:hypothetical protein